MYGIFQFLEQVDKNLLDKSSDDNIFSAMEMLRDMGEEFNAYMYSTKADQNIDGRQKTTLIESVNNETIERMKHQMESMRAAHEQEIKNIKQQKVSSGLQQHQLALADKDQELEQIKQKYVENVNEMDSVKKEAQQQHEKLQLLEQVKQNHIVDMVKMKAATHNQHRQIQELEEGKQTFIAKIENMKQAAQEEHELAETQMKKNLEKRMKTTMKRERIKMQKNMKQEQEKMGKQMKHMKVQMNNMKKALKKQATPLPVLVPVPLQVPVPVPVPVPSPGKETKSNAPENEALVLIQELESEGHLQKVFPDNAKRLTFETAAVPVFSQMWRKSNARILPCLKTFTSGIKDLLSFSLGQLAYGQANKLTLAKALKNKLDSSQDFLSFLQNKKNQKDMDTLAVDSLLKRVIVYSNARGGRSSHFNLAKILKMIEVFELFQKVKVKVSKQQIGTAVTAVLVYGKLKENDAGINYIDYSAEEEVLPSLYTYLCTIQKDVLNMNNQDFGKHLKKLLHVDKNHTPVVNKLTGMGKAEKKHLWSKSSIPVKDRTEAVHFTLAYFSCHFKAAFYVHNTSAGSLEKINFFNFNIQETCASLNQWEGEGESL